MEQWKKLYDVAIKIKKMKPWEKLWDMHISSIILDLCEQVGIEIVQSGKLRAIDEFIESFYQFRF